MKHSGFLASITLVSLLRVLLKNNSGKKRRRPGMIMVAKSSLKKFGVGKMNMVVKLIISSRGMVLVLIGNDLPLLSMSRDLPPSQKHLFVCSIRALSIGIQGLSTGVVL